MLDAILAQSRDIALIMGPIAMVGLLLQKKHATDAISGVMKTIIGFMVFNIGPLTTSGVTQTFTDSFSIAFGVGGVTTQIEVATSLVLNTYGTEVTLTMLLGFVVDLIAAKFTRFRAIFLAGQRFLYSIYVIALIFIVNGLPMPPTVIAGGVLLGFRGATLPPFCQPFMDKIMGADSLTMGHFSCISYAFSGYVEKLFGKIRKNTKEKKDASTVNMSKFFELFRDFIFPVALFMVVLFYVTVIARAVSDHIDIVLEEAGNDIWLVYPFPQGLQLATGISVLIYDVRQSIVEVTATFVTISEKYIPNSKPAVDYLIISPFAPIAILIGSAGVFAGGLAAMAIMTTRNSSVIMILAAGICFFSGGTCGIFGNAYDGQKGALVGSFIVGMTLTGLPLILCPVFADLGVSGASSPNIDYNIIGAFLNWILGIFA